ncbi:MAG: glycoside hydrolase family 15 protein [Thaumarchaeota archaeon]|nr:glycoside hydrolase family 15 protein [Nitrososphaerota archaeon]
MSSVPSNSQVTRNWKSGSGFPSRTIDQSKVENEYKEISDYGIIGDLKTCALVGIDGSIDWFCTPRFDSPSVFASLLDIKKGGRFRICPVDERYQVSQYYEHETNILVTESSTSSGVVSITDFMPCFKVSGVMVSSAEIHRSVRCLVGNAKVRVILQPRMNYGKDVPNVSSVENLGFSFLPSDPITKQELALLTQLRFKITEGTLSTEFELKAGEKVDLVLRYGGAKIHHSENAFTDIKLKQTRTFWKKWSSSCRYNGKWRDQVLRSALVLKLLEYSPTGAIVAAPTTSLPEEIGGTRNWDYRYSWIRDSSFVLWAFHNLGFKSEAKSYLAWLTSIFYLTGGNLQIMLGIGGDRDLSESNLESLEGYKGSHPVRTGNGAWDQFQLDVFGVLLDSMYFSNKHGKKMQLNVYEYLVRPIVGALQEAVEQPDCGIWEVRGQKEHFVYSKVWSWVALDRASKIAGKLNQVEDSRSWRKLADDLKEDILNRGYDSVLKSFVRSYGSKELDSADLLMPQLRFIDAKDPMMLSTIDAIRDRLLVDNRFLYRYTVSDGLPGREGAFLICSFWMVKCLAMAGRDEEAETMFEELMKYSNHLGLFSEEIDPKTGAMLGNFPQAFTHVGLITAATSLGVIGRRHS